MNISDRKEDDFGGNRDMAMADAFVRQTGYHLFLTGRAGTGKTTFLKNLTASCQKQIMVTAPTGVAAVNAGGVTLHSFFQLPFGPYIPGRTDLDNRRFFRFSKEKKRIIQGLDLLVIDEISMVRADLLDGVDAVLRKLRRNDAPFGGVQLLLIGDLFQLPPVAKPDEWQLLESQYESVYFFSSHALARTRWVTIELKTIYRQSDPDFIRLLNAVRENRVDDHTAALLNQCADKGLPETGYITLTTHNKKADAINRERLARLGETAHTLEAEVSGDFPDHAFPTPDRLVLKKGAQVMFLRNDSTPEKAYYNGKIGRVTGIESDTVYVSCEREDGSMEPAVGVAPVEWENIAYKVNEADQTIEQEVIGKFKQCPLKPAWAVTIHKSQGLTFDRAIVDAEDAFAHGQTYVALSRCRSLGGLVLSSQVRPGGIGADPAVVRFMDQATRDHDLEEIFRAARLAYQQGLLVQCFDCTSFQGLFYYFIRLVENNQNSVRVSGLKDVEALRAGARDQIFSVSEKFIRQLQGLMGEGHLPEAHPPILERTRKASAWFGEKLDEVFGGLLEKGGVETDNKALAKQMKNGLDTLKQAVRVKKAGIRSCSRGFSVDDYLRAISGAALTAPAASKKKASPDYTEFDIDHPELFASLKAWRGRIAKAEGVPHFQVLHQKVLVQIAVCLPNTIDALAALKGVGPKTLEKYGDDLVAMVNVYREKKKLARVDLPEPKPIAPEKEAEKSSGKAPKKKGSGPSTRQVSLALFESGKSVEEIAEERGLAANTIMGHLAAYVETGQVKIGQLVDPDKAAAIEVAVSPDKPLGLIKKELGADFSYGEIQAVMAHLKNTG